MAISPDGRVLASVGADQVLRLADLESGEATFAVPLGAAAVAVACSASTVVAVVGKRVWRINALAGRRLDELRLGAPGAAVSVSRDGQHLACVDERGGVRVFRLATGRLVARWSEPVVRAIAWTPDGMTVWCLEEEGRLVCRTREGEVVRGPVQDEVEAFVVSPSGRVAVADARGLGWMDDVQRCRVGATAMAVLPGTERLVWAGFEGWGLDGGVVDGAPAQDVAAHPSGLGVAVASAEGAVTVWTVDPPTPCGHA